MARAIRHGSQASFLSLWGAVSARPGPSTPQKTTMATLTNTGEKWHSDKKSQKSENIFASPPPGGGGAHPVTAPGFHPPDAKYRRLPSLLSRRFPHPMPLTFQTLNQPDTVDFPSAAPLFRPAPAPAQRAVTPQPGPAGHAIDLSNPEGCQTVRNESHPGRGARTPQPGDQSPYQFLP